MFDKSVIQCVEKIDSVTSDIVCLQYGVILFVLRQCETVCEQYNKCDSL